MDVAPGTSTFTRMQRGASSWIQLRAKLRIADLPALHALNDGTPVSALVDPVTMTLLGCADQHEAEAQCRRLPLLADGVVTLELVQLAPCTAYELLLAGDAK